MPADLPAIDLASLDFTRPIARIEDIRAVNPQRFEFEMLTAVVHLDPVKHLIVGYKDLTAGERDRIEASCTVERMVIGKGGKRKIKKDFSMEGIRAKFVAACVVDEAGVPLFTESDVKTLSGLNAKALDRIFTAIQERNGLRDEDLDVFVENFNDGQSDE